jgi:hypothetical protein
MILSLNVFTYAIKTLTEECILIVWLFLMKIGCFGISMMRNVIDYTDISNQVPKFHDVHHVWVKTFLEQQFLKCDCLLYER